MEKSIERQYSTKEFELITKGIEALERLKTKNGRPSFDYLPSSTGSGT